MEKAEKKGNLFGRFLGKSRDFNIAHATRWSVYFVLAIFGFSLMGVLYSAYLTYLELFVIYAICRWCVASAVIMAVFFILSILNLNYGREE